MLKRMLKPLMAASLAVASLFGTAAAEEMSTINFGIISTESSQNLKTVWEPFLADMEKILGKTVKPFFAPDYAGIIQAMRFDKVDVAWYGNKSAMEAVDRAGGEIFAQTVDVSGNPGYWSLLVAHKDSPLNSVEDVLANASNLVFGNGDPNSTSGFLVPAYYVFATHNVDPKKAFKRVLNSSHEVNLLAVTSKQVDFATNNTENLSRFKVTNPDKAGDVKVIWTSPLIPSDPIVWRKNLPESVKGPVYEFFMTYGKSGDPAELKVLEGLQWAPFKPSSDDQLLPIRQLAIYTEKQKVQNDDKLSATDKQQKLAGFDEQLAALERRMAALDARQ